MNERMPISAESRVARAEHVRSRRFDDDLVMIDLEGGEYFSLDAIGARMWELLTSGETPAKVAATLAREYVASEDVILEDCTKLVEELVKRRLAVVLP